MANMTFTAGRLLLVKARMYLAQQEILTNIEYVEGHGVFERDFFVMGSDEEILHIRKQLDAWALENDLA